MIKKYYFIIVRNQVRECECPDSQKSKTNSHTFLLFPFFMIRLKEKNALTAFQRLG